MSSPEKGMSPEEASMRKIAGHLNEHDYAKLIGATVNKGSHTRKKDVMDSPNFSSNSLSFWEARLPRLD